MKNIFLALSVMFISTGIFAQQAQAKKAEETVKFKETVYDFGKIKQGVPVTHDFEFTNTSAKPVVIETATASCGCTTPSWPQAPVAKGKTDKIKAGFNAAAPGSFTKQITVKIAGVDTPTQLTIKGEVLSAEDYSKLQK
ncbi:MAG: DUF1573 domain-containing protein [Chitinophagaceae bacterium]|nr:DUF1573 domain-containing protein [Chitinophagaceae bacterium]